MMEVPISFRRDFNSLTCSLRRSIPYRNQSIDLQSKSMDWFLNHMNLCCVRVKQLKSLEGKN